MKAKMKISTEQILKMERAVRRKIDIITGFQGCLNKRHKSAKDYNRQRDKRVIL